MYKWTFKNVTAIVVMVMMLCGMMPWVNFGVGKVYAATVNFSGTLTTDKSFNRPDIYTLAGSSTTPVLSDFTGCTPASDSYNYFTRSITPDITGDYTIEVTSANLNPGTDPVNDGYGYPGNTSAHDDTTMYIYDNSFNPLNPINGLLWANDDIAYPETTEGFSSSNNYKSKISNVTLTAGQTYTIVVTSFKTGVTGDVAFSITGPGNVTVSANPYSSDVATISGNAGIAGATLSYTDGGSKTVTADVNGDGSITVADGGGIPSALKFTSS